MSSHAGNALINCCMYCVQATLQVDPVSRVERCFGPRPKCWLPLTAHVLFWVLQSFSALDLEFITELSKEVMVIPVCAKSDAMTVDERTTFQQLIRDRLTAGAAHAYAHAHAFTLAPAMAGMCRMSVRLAAQRKELVHSHCCQLYLPAKHVGCWCPDQLHACTARLC